MMASRKIGSSIVLPSLNKCVTYSGMHIRNKDKSTHISCAILWKVWVSSWTVRLAPVLKTFFINVSFHILVASLTLMALSSMFFFLKDRVIRVRLATSV